MATKDLQILNLKLDQVMFNSLVFTWERNFEVTFGVFLALVSQINVLESYRYLSVLTSVMIKDVTIVNQSFTNISSLPKQHYNDLPHFASV